MRIGVLVVNHNFAHFLLETLDSVRNQTRPPDVVVVVDNGSTDRSLEILDAYQSEWRELMVIRQRNIGQLGAWREGLRALDRNDVDVVTLLDGDDWYESGYLSRVAEEYKTHPALEVAYSSYLMHPLETYGPVMRDAGWIGGDFLRAVFQLKWVGLPTSMISLRSDTADMLFGSGLAVHDAAFRQRSDDLIVIGGSIRGLRRRFIEEPLVNYRVHASNQLAGRPIIPWEEQLQRDLALQRLIEPTRALFRSMTSAERRILLEVELNAVTSEDPDPWQTMDDLLRVLPIDEDELGELSLMVAERLPNGPQK